MRLSTKARYAVMAMVDIAKYTQNVPTSLTAIAERQQLPLAYLEQLFVKLRKAGLVNSSRGASGGYMLARLDSDIRILDIITAVDKPLKAVRCDNQSSRGCQAHGQRCLTHDLWEELGMVVHLFLSRVTLADVCAKRVLGVGRYGANPLQENIQAWAKI